MPDYDPPQPEATKRAPYTATQVRELYEELRGRHNARNADFTKFGNLYRGKHWDIGAGLISDPDRYHLTANYIGPVVDKSVEGLVGIMPAIQVIPPGAEQTERDLAEQMENVLYGTWALNRMDKVLRRIAHNVVLKRRGYLYMWFDHTRKRVRYRSIAPENYFPLVDGDETIECIVVSTRLTRELRRRYPNVASQIESDSESDEVVVDDPARGGGAGATATTKVIDWFDRDGNWIRVMGEAMHYQNLDYGIDRVPVYEFVNNLVGDESEERSDIENVIELNLYLNKVFSEQADIISKYSDPPIVNEATGNSNTTIQRAVRGKGSVIEVKKGGKLGYLNWDGTMPEIGAQIDRTFQMLHDLSGKPPSAFGQTVTNQSGVVTNLALTPTVAQTTARETLMGATLVEINADTLKLYEKFCRSEQITFAGTRKGRTPHQNRYFKVQIAGGDIRGWTENRIKWPSAYRVDDPVYVQNILQQAQSDPPLMPVYDAIEELGAEDVEGRLDRLAMQLEDPRFHPDRMKQAVDMATALAGTELPADLEGLGGAAGGLTAEDVNDAAEATGSPDRSALVAGV